MPEYEPRLADAFWDLRDDAYDHPERWQVSASDIFQRLAELVETAEDSGGLIDWRRDVAESMLRWRSAGTNNP
ncbi:hypothetical protein [Phycicoccus jejuensis]|uniref:hypothetical protein n=1 Tax=Phycicoccus jejuensis TaxID=367299 RepID=UPI0004C40C9D|nr:hypothetical protein [Phycicoccus jejuensis]